jgi:hypothetical protein
LEDVSETERIVSGWMTKILVHSGRVIMGSSASRYRPVAGFCEHGNELLRFHKRGRFF